jgi:hypothetical protein
MLRPLAGCRTGACGGRCAGAVFAAPAHPCCCLGTGCKQLVGLMCGTICLVLL